MWCRLILQRGVESKAVILALPALNMAERRTMGVGGFQMTARRTKINLLVVSVAYLINMSASYSLEGLQSSLNADIGTSSLSTLYSSVVVSALFLPPLSLHYLKCRKSMALGTLPYAFYALANCYPKVYTLIPAAMALGAGSSMHFSALRLYVGNLARMYAARTKREVTKATTLFFGIFYAIFALSMLFGNIFSSLLFQFSSRPLLNSTDGIVAENGSLSVFNATSDHAVKNTPLSCGLHDCDGDAVNASSLNASEAPASAQVGQTTLYIVFLVYAAMTVVAVLLFRFGADEVPNDIGPVGPLLCDGVEEKRQCDNSYRSHSPQKDTQLEDKASDAGVLVEVRATEGQWKMVLHKILATGKFMLTTPTAQLLIPITLHVGQLQAFAYGQFTRYWITCYSGIEYVGYVMSAFGLGSTTGGLLTGQLVKLVSRSAIVVSAAIAELGVCVLLLTWEPAESGKLWIFFLVIFCCGFLHAIHKTIQMSVYMIFFAKNKEAASASLSFWDPLGTSLAYAYGTMLCNRIIIYLLMSLLSLGTVLFLVAEHFYRKERRMRSPPN